MMLQEFIYDLKGLLNEDITCEEFREKYFSQNSSTDYSALPNLVGSLSHYIDDEDIRKKDTDYREMQKNELEKLICFLESGAPLEELQKIHFLGSTE